MTAETDWGVAVESIGWGDTFAISSALRSMCIPLQGPPGSRAGSGFGFGAWS